MSHHKKRKQGVLIIGVCLILFSVNVIYTEIRLTTLPYDLRVERSYDISVWLRLIYSESQVVDQEIPLMKPPIPVYNNEFEVIRWVYQYGHTTLNISNIPAYRDALLLIYAPRAVLQVFSDVECMWSADGDTGLLHKHDFLSVGAFYLAQDSRIETTIWQEYFAAPLYIDVTLTV